MRRILAHPDPLTTRIGERLMTMRSPLQPPTMPAERRRLQQSDRSQQIDLFDGVTPAQTPAWRERPGEEREKASRPLAPPVREPAHVPNAALPERRRHAPR